MNKEFILPDIGEGIVECEVIEWKVREGDIIEEDQIVVDVSTDKAIVEIPSMYNGRITKLHENDCDDRHFHEFVDPVNGMIEQRATERIRIDHHHKSKNPERSDRVHHGQNTIQQILRGATCW